jgi:hypothetical protein
MPTSTLGIVLDSEKINQLLGVINATLGDFKLLFYLLLGAWIALFIIDKIVGLGVFSGKKHKKDSKIIDDDNDDDDDDDDDDDE